MTTKSYGYREESSLVAALARDDNERRKALGIRGAVASDGSTRWENA